MRLYSCWSTLSPPTVMVEVTGFSLRCVYGFAVGEAVIGRCDQTSERSSVVLEPDGLIHNRLHLFARGKSARVLQEDVALAVGDIGRVRYGNVGRQDHVR